MRRFTGIAAIAIAAYSGFAWAQPTTVTPPDEMQRNRTERPGPNEMAPRAPRESERGMPRPEEPARQQRGAQTEEFRGRDPQQLQQRDREPGQRERPASPLEQRAQPRPQKEQPQQERGQAQRLDERNGRPASSQARPNDRSPGSPETAQPQRPDDRPNAPNTAQPAPSRQNGERPGATAQRTTPTQPGAQPGENRNPPAGRTADRPRTETDNQRIADTVRERVERREVRPEQNLGASVTVGARLPSRVQLQRLPRDIASIRPQYRDYRYTVSDREIVIVDPHDRRIVEVIDRGGGRPSSGAIFGAFEHQRDVRRWRRPAAVAFEVGVVLPASAPYYNLPVEVAERNPQWRGYQYVMTENQDVAIVEPRTHRIVDVVERDTSRSASAAPAPAGAAAGQPGQAAQDERHELARMILSQAKPGEMQGADGLRGAVLPNETRLQPLPAEVEERDQQLRGYQYTLIGDDVLIVDPQSRQVVDVIE